MNYKNLKFRELEFVEEKREALSSTFEQRIVKNEEMSRKIARILNPRPLPGSRPLRLKKSLEFSWWLYFKSMFFINFESKKDKELFYVSVFQLLFPRSVSKLHCNRMMQWEKRRRLYYVIIFILTILIIFLGIDTSVNLIQTNGIRFSFITSDSQKIALNLLAALTFYLFLAVAIRTSQKIADAITLKPFADSICALTCIYIVIALDRPDVLLDSQKRAQLIDRIDALAHNTLSLAWRFTSRSDSEHKWSVEHFRFMERYIRERERWVIVPMESTLEDLRKDFYELANIYFYGNYGNFDWTKVKTPPQSPATGLRQKTLSTLPKFASIILPIILFALLFWQKSQAEYMGIGINIVALILISWFLLAVDAALKLGIVSGAVNLAKEIRGIK